MARAKKIVEEVQPELTLEPKFFDGREYFKVEEIRLSKHILFREYSFVDGTKTRELVR